MGYQESFLKFKNEKIMIEELKKYKQRNTENDVAEIVCIDRAKTSLKPFKKGELIMVIGGERYAQRSQETLKEELGIENVKDIIFVDNPYYWEISIGNDIGRMLEANFEQLSEEETKLLLES